MEKSLRIVLNYLKSIAMPISQQDELRNLCMISSNGDEIISDICAKVLSTVGTEGTLHIVESSTGRTDFKLVSGLIFNRGFVTPNFVHEESGGNVVE